MVGVRRFSSHIHVLGPMGSTRFASWLKFAPGEFVILGVLPATLRVASRSKIVLCSASCLAKNPESDFARMLLDSDLPFLGASTGQRDN